MGIGTSLGAYYDDSFHQSAAQWDPKYDDNEYTVEGDQNDVDSRNVTPKPISDVRDVPYSGSNLGPLQPQPKLPNPTPTPLPTDVGNPQNLPDFTDVYGTPDLPTEQKNPDGSHVLFKTSSPLVNITDEDIDKGIGIAMSFGAGTMKGVKSNTIYKPDLYRAQNMELDGAGHDEIYEKTGTFRGDDGRWRQEIDDSKATLNNKGVEHTITPAVEGSDGMGRGGWGSVGGREALHTISIKKPTTLENVLNHPDLFEAYPFLRHAKVSPMDASEAWGKVTSDGTIHLAKDLDPEFSKSVLLHEVQHIIQHHEGFAQGGNAQQFLPPSYKALESVLMRAEQEGKSLDPELLDNAKKAMIETYKNAHEMYQKLGGEVEARNVQTRMNMDKFSRALIPPKKTAK